MQTGRSFFVVECSIKSILKIYVKILLFVCIFWIATSSWYYFNILPESWEKLPKISTSDITQLIRGRKSENLQYAIVEFPYWIKSTIKRSKKSLYQMMWLPIALLPCTIFLFHWISKREKEEIKAKAFVPWEDIKLRTEVDIEKTMRVKNRNKGE